MMLRRLFSASTRKVLLQQEPLVTSTTTLKIQRCSLIYFTEQDQELADQQEIRGFTTNMWVSKECVASDLQTSVRPGEGPVEIMAHITFELLNLSVFEGPVVTPDGEPLAEPLMHTSLRTGSPYNRLFQSQMDERARTHDFTSKFWLTVRDAKSRNLRRLQKTQPPIFQTTSLVEMFNADQLRSPSKLLEVQLDGASNRIYPLTSPKGIKLAERQKQRGYARGLWFDVNVLEQMGLLIGTADPEPYDPWADLAKEAFGEETSLKLPGGIDSASTAVTDVSYVNVAQLRNPRLGFEQSGLFTR